MIFNLLIYFQILFYFFKQIGSGGTHINRKTLNTLNPLGQSIVLVAGERPQLHRGVGGEEETARH